MMSDIELFIVTWSLGLSALISWLFLVYSSMHLHYYKLQSMDDGPPIRIRMNEKEALRVRIISIITLILAVTAGVIIRFVNWIPTTQYIYPSALFRVFSVPASGFMTILTLGGLAFFLFRSALKDNSLDNYDERTQNHRS